MTTGNIFALPGGLAPVIDPTAWVAPGAVIVGKAQVGARSSIWYNAVLRADSNTITIGEESNLQDGVVVHVDSDFPTMLGRRVSVGHNAVIHGATIEDGCLIGMSATVLNGAVVGAGSLVAAGALVREGQTVPPRSLVAGVPAKVIRELTDDEVRGIDENAEIYLGHTERHAKSQNIQ